MDTEKTKKRVIWQQVKMSEYVRIKSGSSGRKSANFVGVNRSRRGEAEHLSASCLIFHPGGI